MLGKVDLFVGLSFILSKTNNKPFQNANTTLKSKKNMNKVRNKNEIKFKFSRVPMIVMLTETHVCD